MVLKGRGTLLFGPAALLEGRGGLYFNPVVLLKGRCARCTDPPWYYKVPIFYETPSTVCVRLFKEDDNKQV